MMFTKLTIISFFGYVSYKLYIVMIFMLLEYMFLFIHLNIMVNFYVPMVCIVHNTLQFYKNNWILADTKYSNVFYK